MGETTTTLTALIADIDAMTPVNPDGRVNLCINIKVYGFRIYPEAGFLGHGGCSMTNGIEPGHMTPAERLNEVGMLLSLAMMRLWMKRRLAAGRQRTISRDFSQIGKDCLELPRRTSPDGAVQPRREFIEK